MQRSRCNCPSLGADAAPGTFDLNNSIWRDVIVATIAAIASSIAVYYVMKAVKK